MADNYFDFIGQNAGEEKKEVPQETQAMANVTVRADVSLIHTGKKMRNRHQNIQEEIKI